MAKNKSKKNKRKKISKFSIPKNLIEAYIRIAYHRDNGLTAPPEITPEFERAYAFFNDLFQDRCVNENEYSVKEIAEKKGIAYEQVLNWAQQNDLFAFGLELIKQSCYCNAQDAGLHGILEYEKMVRYSVENLDEADEEGDLWVQELKRIDQENFEKSEKVYTMSEEITTKEDNTKLCDTFNEEEQRRIDSWIGKRKSTDLRFKFKADSTYNADTKKTDTTIRSDFDEDVTIDQRCRLGQSTYFAATGSSSIDYAAELFAQMMSAIGKTDADSLNANFKALLAMKPQDEYEGMLISRLLVLHSQYMDYMARANVNSTNKESRESYINSATKLMRVYNETLEALNKYRRKGEQKVTVTHNHVNVNDGGKAIVGSEINQKPGGGDHDNK